MERSALPEWAARDGVARPKRLPARRSAASAPAALALLFALAPLSVSGDVARALMYLATIAAVGITVFALVVDDAAAPPPESLTLRQLTLAAALIAVIASLLGLAIEIAAISGRGLSGIGDSAAFAIVVRNGFCWSVLMRVAGLGLIAFAAYYGWETLAARVFAGTGIALSCLWCLLTGHEVTHGLPVHLAIVLHMLAASIWLGGLVALGITLPVR